MVGIPCLKLLVLNEDSGSEKFAVTYAGDGVFVSEAGRSRMAKRRNLDHDKCLGSGQQKMHFCHLFVTSETRAVRTPQPRTRNQPPPTQKCRAHQGLSCFTLSVAPGCRRQNAADRKDEQPTSALNRKRIESLDPKANRIVLARLTKRVDYILPMRWWPHLENALELLDQPGGKPSGLKDGHSS